VCDRAITAHANTCTGQILYPFILREIEPGLTDITTPYGYGGPFFSGDCVAAAPEFWDQFGAWARSQGVVSEFIRFSLFQDMLLPYPGEREQKLVNIVRNLDVEEEEIWRDFDHKVRKNVSKARRSDVIIEIDETGSRLDEFYRIYVGTMKRREARSGYYFPLEFFESIAAGLAGQFVFFHAVHNGIVVSTELALVSVENIYSFLGGTEESAFDLRPNDLLKYELILWAKGNGKRRFVLGGGYLADDGIFRYKRAFAPSGIIPYYVGRRIFDQTNYDRLVAAHVNAVKKLQPDWNTDPGFFPAYRVPISA
jgi:hypothetical protein